MAGCGSGGVRDGRVWFWRCEGWTGVVLELRGMDGC